MKKLEKALYYAKKQVENGSVYIWSGQGELLKKISLIDLTKMENSAVNAGRVAQHIYDTKSKINAKAKAFDCSGLVISALVYASVLIKGFDTTAAGLYNTFEHIRPEDRKPGDLLYKMDSSGKIVHVGIVLNYNKVIEAKGRDYGVVISDITSAWEKANRPDY